MGPLSLSLDLRIARAGLPDMDLTSRPRERLWHSHLCQTTSDGSPSKRLGGTMDRKIEGEYGKKSIDHRHHGAGRLLSG